MSVNPLGVRRLDEPLDRSRFIRAAFMRSLLFKTHFQAVIPVWSQTLPLYSTDSFSQLTNGRWRREYVALVRVCSGSGEVCGGERGGAEITLCLNDVQAETMGRRSD